MQTDRHYTGYARARNGDIVYIESDDSAHYGYYLIVYDGNKYDGGQGSGYSEWQPIKESNVYIDFKSGRWKEK